MARIASRSLRSSGWAEERLVEGLEPAVLADEEHRLLGREVAEEGAGRHPGSLGDLVGGGGVVALLTEQSQGGLLQRPLGAQLVRLATRRLLRFGCLCCHEDDVTQRQPTALTLGCLDPNVTVECHLGGRVSQAEPLDEDGADEVVARVRRSPLRGSAFRQGGLCAEQVDPPRRARRHLAADPCAPRRAWHRRRTSSCSCPPVGPGPDRRDLLRRGTRRGVREFGAATSARVWFCRSASATNGRPGPACSIPTWSDRRIAGVCALSPKTRRPPPFASLTSLPTRTSRMWSGCGKVGTIGTARSGVAPSAGGSSRRSASSPAPLRTIAVAVGYPRDRPARPAEPGDHADGGPDIAELPAHRWFATSSWARPGTAWRSDTDPAFAVGGDLACGCTRRGSTPRTSAGSTSVMSRCTWSPRSAAAIGPLARDGEGPRRARPARVR